MSHKSSVLLNNLASVFSGAKCHIESAIIDKHEKLLFVRVKQGDLIALLDCRRAKNIGTSVNGDEITYSLIIAIQHSRIDKNSDIISNDSDTVYSSNEYLSVDGNAWKLVDYETWKLLAEDPVTADEIDGIEIPKFNKLVQIPLASFKQVYDLAKSHKLNENTFPRLQTEDIEEEDEIIADSDEEPNHTGYDTDDTDNENDKIVKRKSSNKIDNIVDALRETKRLRDEIIDVINGTINNLEKESEETETKLEEAQTKMERIKNVIQNRPGQQLHLETALERYKKLIISMKNQKNDNMVLAHNLIHMLNQVIGYMCPPNDD